MLLFTLPSPSLFNNLFYPPPNFYYNMCNLHCPGEEAERAEALALALGKTAAVDSQIQALTDWLDEAEQWLKGCDPVGNTYDELVTQLSQHKVRLLKILFASD